MSFLFDLSNADYGVHRRSLLRLLIGDTVEGDGPRPNRANFQDDELDAFVLLEADNLDRAAARAIEALAAQWARYAGSYRLGPESEEMRQSAAFADRAKEMRGVHGFTTADDSDGTGDSAVIDWSGVYKDWVGKF